MTKLVLIASLFIMGAILVSAYPQLDFESDQRESADDAEALALTRTRRGSALEGSPGHHHQTYHPQTSYGQSNQGFTGHGSHGGGGYGGHGQSTGYGHGSSHGHGHQSIGPVFTFVRTDYHGNFQTGVRHRVGGGGGGWGR